MSESLLIPKLIETSTFNTLDYLKQQQLAIQKQLMEQEILNKNLYERLFNSGFLTTASTTLATSTSFLDSIRKKFNLNDNESSTSEPNVTKAQSGANILSALLPFGDMMSGISQIFTKLFGSEYWMYWFLAIFIGKIIYFFKLERKRLENLI